MKNIFLLLIVFIPISLHAQKHDNTWLFGYQSYAGVEGVGGSRIDFTDIQIPDVYYEYRDMDFRAACAVTSDKKGELLFYTNGVLASNSEHEEIEDSFGMNWGPEQDEFDTPNYNLWQGVLTLPAPKNNDLYYTFHLERRSDSDNSLYYCPTLMYTTFDVSQGTDAVILKEKGVILNEGVLAVNGLTATKHANGRDWWIIHTNKTSNFYYLYLLSPEGVELNRTIETGPEVIDGIEQSKFSPDGNVFVRYEVFDITGGIHLVVYDFDRCTGELNFRNETYDDNFALAVGLEISPNSRYAYCSSFEYIFQYDLWAEDIASTKDTLALYDGSVAWTGLQTNFWMSQLAPDGKIYIATQGGTNFLHIIHQPNEGGEAARVEQRGLQLPTLNLWTIPNNPNYRLGPIDGSACDTLGLNNNPLCDFRYTIDSTDARRIEFTSVSHYEPEHWHWTMGDGECLSEVNPVYTYLQDGVYEVCLTVSNEYGSDTKCRTIEIRSDQPPVFREEEITSQPNPARDFVYLQMYPTISEGTVWQLHDIQGRLMQTEILPACNRQRVDLTDLSPGIYIQSLSEGNKVFWQDKVVVVE